MRLLLPLWAPPVQASVMSALMQGADAVCWYDRVQQTKHPSNTLNATLIKAVRGRVADTDLPLSLSAVQERLTKQIAVAITESLQPSGVGVVIEARYSSSSSSLLHS